MENYEERKRIAINALAAKVGKEKAEKIFEIAKAFWDTPDGKEAVKKRRLVDDNKL